MSIPNDCPRCKNTFTEIIPKIFNKCYNCELSCIGVTYSKSTYTLPKFLNDCDLSWIMKNNRCYYLTAHKTYELPWLPFDITAEKLKTLLAFI